MRPLGKGGKGRWISCLIDLTITISDLMDTYIEYNSYKFWT